MHLLRARRHQRNLYQPFLLIEKLKGICLDYLGCIYHYSDEFSSILIQSAVDFECLASSTRNSYIVSFPENFAQMVVVNWIVFRIYLLAWRERYASAVRMTIQFNGKSHSHDCIFAAVSRFLPIMKRRLHTVSFDCASKMFIQFNRNDFSHRIFSSSRIKCDCFISTIILSTHGTNLYGLSSWVWVRKQKCSSAFAQSRRRAVHVHIPKPSYGGFVLCMSAFVVIQFTDLVSEKYLLHAIVFMDSKSVYFCIYRNKH